MSKDLYSKRLESLFSDADRVAPAPDPAPAAPAEAPLASAVNGRANGAHDPAPAGAPSPAPVAAPDLPSPGPRRTTGLLGGGTSDADRFFDLSQELLCIVGPDGLFKRVNPAFERTLGWTVRELLKARFLDLVHPGDLPATTAETDKLHQGATAVRVANRFRCRDGQDRWISWIVQATADGALYIIGHDITDRRQAEEALRESEARYRSLVESSHDAVVSVGGDGRFLFFNRVWLDTLGYTAEEMSRRTLFEVMHPDSMAHCQPLFVRLMAGEPLNGIEVTFVTRDGVSVVMEGNSSPRWQNGQVVATQTIFRNITARRQAEDDLLKFRYALEHSTDAVFMTDLNGVIQYVNPAFEALYGYPRSEAIGRTPRIIKSGLIPPDQYAYFWKALLNKQVVAGEIVNKAKDGRLIPIEGSNTPIVDGAGGIVGFMAIHRDISARKQAEERLQLQSTALASMSSAVVITDPMGFIQWVNPAFTAITGYSLEEAVGQHTSVMKSGQHAAAVYQELWNTLLAGQVWSGELVNRRKDGRLYPEEQVITPVKNERGEITWFVSVKQDITERKQAEATLRAGEAQLAEVLKIAQLANWEYDVVNDLFTFNDQFYALLRTTAEREGGYTMSSAQYAQRFVHPDDAPIVGQEIQKALATPDPNYSAQIDHRILYADGQPGYITVRFRIQKDEHGRTVKTFGANQDITERKRAEAAIQAEQQRTQTILETVTVPMIISRLADSRVLYANQALAEVGRIALTELIGGRAVDYFASREDRQKVVEALQKHGFISNFETQLRRGDEGLYWALLSARLINYQGETCVLTTYVDITERKQAEAAAARRTGELEMLNDIGRILAARGDLKAALSDVGAKLCQTFRVDTGFIALYDSRTNFLEFPYNVDAGQPLEVAPRLMAGGLAAHVIQSRQPLLLSEGTAERLRALGAVLVGSGDYAQSWLGVPIPAGADVIGVLNVQTSQPNWFTAEDVRLLSTIAASIGAEIENARLYEQARRRASELAVINEIMGFAAASLDVTQTLDIAAREVARLVKARSCGVGLLDADRQFLTIVADHGDPDQPKAVGLRLPLEGNLSTVQAVETKRTVVIADAQTDPLTESVHPLMRERHTYALVIVPLVARNDVIGTIALDSDDPARQFAPDEIAILETVARELGGAIENARLFEQVQRRAADLATVAQVGATVATLREQDAMLQTVVDLTKERFHLYHAHVYLLNAERDTLVLVSGAGEVGRQMVAEGRRIPLSRQQSLVAQAARERRAVLVNDVRQDPHFLPHPLLPDTRAELAAPLVAGDEVLGVLDVQSDQAGRFGEADASIQAALAAQVAVALQNARSFQRSEQALADLNTLTRRLTRESWRGYLSANGAQDYAYQYDLSAVEPLQAIAAPAPDPEPGLALPLVVQGEAVGQLRVAEPGLVDADAQAIVNAVADRLSSHLENLRLTEQTMESLSRQERLSSQLETVVQVTTVASTLLEARQLLQEVVDLTQARFGLEQARIYLYDEVGETLQLAAWSGAEAPSDQARILPVLLAQSIVARAARTRQPVIVGDAQALPGGLADMGAATAGSEMALPMLVGERLLGVFDVRSDQVGRFTEEDARIQGTLAAQVAIALQNANLYAEQAATVARLKELDHLKSTFLANMSHELRTPLNSILGFTDVILEGLDGPLTDRMDNDLRVVQKNGQHLLNLINDILDMAKIEAGRMTISPEAIHLADLIDEVMDITGSLAREKRLHLTPQLPPDEDLVVEADHVRLRQVLINLVGNSIKFTEQGGVTVSAEAQDEKTLICVADTGIGIPPAKLDTIFEAFSQVDTSTTRKVGGTGLGLPISRHLIELHGGRLWAESTGVAGEGSRFYIELPAEFKRPALETETA